MSFIRSFKFKAIVFGVCVLTLVFLYFYLFNESTQLKRKSAISSAIGLDRKIIVRNNDGSVFRTFEGRFKVEYPAGGIVSFIHKGKKYTFVNRIVDMQEK